MRLVEGTAHVDDVGEFVAKLDEIGEREGCTVQAFDARYVVDREHLERALERADRAIERGENVARNRGVEILLYAAGRRQIDDALTMGVHEGDLPVVVLVDAEARTAPDRHGGPEHRDDDARERRAAAAVAELLDPAETLGDVDADAVRDFFEVSRRELDATAGDLADVVHERVALLDVEK
jgi:KEOPS complex subunit Cgi121